MHSSPLFTLSIISFQGPRQVQQSAEDAYIQAETERLSNRLAAAMNKCEEYANNPDFTGISVQGRAWVYAPKNLVYCVTHKVGCTFWKRIFRFLGHDYSGSNVSRPTDIDRRNVHYGNLKTIRERPLSNPVIRALLSQKHINAFMFSRDPYTRLWSAYVDKFFLPDFWRSDGPGIVANIRTNASVLAKNCGNDLTFPEFIKYVVKSLSKGNNLNEHFNPIFKQCSPCHMRFDVIGKLETFQKDSKYIFNRFGLNHLSEIVSFSKNVEEEIDMLINYNFDLENRVKKDCFSRIDVAQRLWKAFQITGYLSKDVPFPLIYVQSISNTVNMTELFKEQVFKVINEQRTDTFEFMQQKKTFLVQAFKGVPSSDLEMIPKLFRQDFELFGYEKYPNLFSFRNHTKPK